MQTKEEVISPGSVCASESEHMYMTFHHGWEINQLCVCHVFVLCLTCLKATLSDCDSEPPQWPLCNVKFYLFIFIAAVRGDIQSMDKKMSNQMMIPL